MFGFGVRVHSFQFRGLRSCELRAGTKRLRGSSRVESVGHKVEGCRSLGGIACTLNPKPLNPKRV